MIIRAATPADAECIALQRYPDEADAAARPAYAAWVAGAIQRGLYAGFLALDGDRGAEQIVAGAGLTLLEWGPSRGDPQPWRARIVNVWTHPDWRRRGLAQGLVTRCLDSARQRGVGRVSLGTSAQARGLYGRLGFQASAAEMWLALPAQDGT
ncbi:GNAT family N-acetyltransferase [Deinococcus koreensis]|uniref:GNAT family N-acetyltransferase n=1 Tax=Deinococcus koreensis TaxID=2054903 RepID=A0A2K3UUM7_9DEIO|nr:N-acetyltransferase [Deinococcus koreensis]PNY80243.1 GNAT family N-acetyltransferase [Deinococcus koreensis]